MLLLGLAAPAAAQTHRNLDIQVADAYEGENIIVTLTLSSAPGSVSAAQRTFTVSTEVPTAGAVNTCIATFGCTAGSTPAAATDFTALASTNTVVFDANETVKTVTISTATDNLSEGLEVVKINIVYTPDGGALGIFTASTRLSPGSEVTGRNEFDGAALVFPTSLRINTYGTISDGTRPAPEISISADTSPVTEGTAASFTVTATPAPRSQSVNLTVTQSGSFVASDDLGSSKTVTIGTSGEATYTVPTVDDSTVEANGSVTVTVNSGTGYTVASAPNNAATVTVEDDDCPAQNNNLSVGSIRVLENGGKATYCVRLTRAPSGGDTTVTIGTAGSYPGAATASPTTLTFMASNYMNPQPVTVTGVDQPNLHLDNRTLSLTHRANGGNYTNFNLGNVQVAVDDAPELEAWDLAIWNINDYAAKQRPNTVKATRGFRYFQNDMTPIYPLRYQLRLSNRPATGETVMVTATSSDISKFGLSLTSGGTPQASLTVTFEDRPADRVCFNGGHSSLFDVYTSNPDASWACYRQIWVISTQQYATFQKGCANITHTASGGGLRSTDIGTIRAHAVAGTVFAPYSAPGRDCPLITEELRPRSAPATAAPAPTEKISNLQVTAVDDVSARITWDAVEHATSYEVSWSAESSDSLSASAGALPGVTGTTTTIQHDALVPMTLTVTVTPEYIDENGVTKQLDALASEATLEVGPGVQRLDSGGGTNGGDGGSIDAGFGAVDLPVPVSHWRFEDDAVDWVGSSHGTEKGGVAFEANEEGEGVESYSLSLDGTDDYIDLASHVSDFPLGDSTRSITGWFKADTGNQRQTFFTYGPNVEGKRFSIAADRTQVLVAVSGHAWGVNGLELEDGWHHIAVTYAGGDSDDILIYLDGELQTASTLAGSSKRLDTQTGPAAIGRSVSGTKYYTGLIDDVRLYDLALSAEHVLALFEEHPQTVLAEDNPEACVSDELAADVEGYSKETWRESPDHVERWLRVLETFSGTASDSRVMTPTEAEGYVNRGWQRWEPVLEALECMEKG